MNNRRAQAIMLNASAQRPPLPRSKEVSIEAIEKDFCPIIYEPLRKLARKGQLVETRCGHQYSRSGINTWLAQKPECPKCRKFTTKNDLINITVKTKKVAEKSSALKAKKEPKKILKQKKSVQSQAQKRK